MAKELSGTDKIKMKLAGAAERAEKAGRGTKLYAELGPPPTDPMMVIAYAAKAAAIAIHDAATDKTLAPSERRKSILDGVRASGMTYAKAAVQRELDEMRERAFGKRKGVDAEELDERRES